MLGRSDVGLAATGLVDGIAEGEAQHVAHRPREHRVAHLPSNSLTGGTIPPRRRRRGRSTRRTAERSSGFIPLLRKLGSVSLRFCWVWGFLDRSQGLIEEGDVTSVCNVPRPDPVCIAHTTGLPNFAECRLHSAKDRSYSAKSLHSAKTLTAMLTLPSVGFRALGKGFAECLDTRQSSHVAPPWAGALPSA